MEIVQPGAGGGVVVGQPVTGGTNNTVLYIDGSGNLGSEAAFGYNDSTNLLAVDKIVTSLGAQNAPAIYGTGDTTSGIYFASGRVLFTASSVVRALVQAESASVAAFTLGSNHLGFSNSIGGGDDVWVSRKAAANLLLGNVASATPIANILTIGEASRSGTDSNVAGANGTIQSGAGTGSATGSNLIFQTPVAGVSGTGAQTQTTQLTVNSTGSTFTQMVTVATTAGFNSLLATNTLANGGTSIELRNDQGTSAYGLLRNYGSTSAASAFGVTLANYTVLCTDGSSSNGLVIGTLTADPVIIGTNNVANLTIASGGIVTFSNIIRAADGAVGTPSISFTSATGTGIYYSGGMNFTAGGTAQYVVGSEGWRLKSTLGIAWSTGDPTVSASDTIIIRGGVATLQLGAANSATPVNYTIQGQGGSGTNIAGASVNYAGGIGTGSGAPGDVIQQTSAQLGTGTTAQSYGDRVRVLGKYTTLTESTATAFASVTVASGTVAGGMILYTVEANDGTDFQCLTGMAPFSIVNKAGTLTMVLGTDSQSVANSTGTLTGTLTMVDAGSGVMQFKMNAVSSLTQTILRINCQIKKNFGAGVIAAI